MLRTIVKVICLLLLLVSMSGCLIGWDDDGWGHRSGGHGGDYGDNHGGGHDHGDRSDGRR